MPRRRVVFVVLTMVARIAKFLERAGVRSGR
jgi:hypothetical protein